MHTHSCEIINSNIATPLYVRLDVEWLDCNTSRLLIITMKIVLQARYTIRLAVSLWSNTLLEFDHLQNKGFQSLPCLQSSLLPSLSDKNNCPHQWVNGKQLKIDNMSYYINKHRRNCISESSKPTCCGRNCISESFKQLITTRTVLVPTFITNSTTKLATSD